MPHKLIDLAIVVVLLVGISWFRNPQRARRGNMAAALALLAAVVVTFRRRGTPRPLARWAAVLGTLFAVQVVIGGVQVLLQIPMLWRALHLAAAGGVWGVLVVLAGLSAPGQAVPERRPAPAPPDSAMPTPAQK